MSKTFIGFILAFLLYHFNDYNAQLNKARTWGLKNVFFNYSGAISQTGLNQLKLLIYQNKNKLQNKTVNITINSTGGHVKAALDFIYFMNLYQANGYKFNILVDGDCMSACFPIFQSADFKGITSNCVLMIHRSYLAFPFGITFYTDYTASLDHIMTIYECQNNFKLDYCYDTIMEMKQKDFYIHDTNLMLEFGFIDTVINKDNTHE